MRRIEGLAQARAAAMRAGLAEQLRAALPGIEVIVEADGLLLVGRDLARRWAAAGGAGILRSMEP